MPHVVRVQVALFVDFEPAPPHSRKVDSARSASLATDALERLNAADKSSRALRADGVRVSIFKQILNARGEWQQAALQTDTQTLVENSILTRAQQFRAGSLK